jgi:hypothetical protein
MLKDLKPFKAPVPVEREACHACKTFAPECLVPDGDEALPMCWLCAHHVIDHNTSIASAHCAECECTDACAATPRALRGTAARARLSARRGRCSIQSSV